MDYFKNKVVSFKKKIRKAAVWEDFSNYGHSIFILIVLFSFLSFIFILVVNFNNLFSVFNFGRPWQIGDTIGGITAPLFGLISAILIYLSFRVQIKANETQRQELRFERSLNVIIELYKEIKSQLDSFEYNNLKGKEAIENWSRDFEGRIKNPDDNAEIIGKAIVKFEKLSELNFSIERLVSLIKKSESLASQQYEDEVNDEYSEAGVLTQNLLLFYEDYLGKPSDRIFNLIKYREKELKDKNQNRYLRLKQLIGYLRQKRKKLHKEIYEKF